MATSGKSPSQVMDQTAIPSGGVAKGLITSLWRSPWTVWVGFRYLRSKKNSQFMSFITFISIFGVMVGVTALIVVLSVMDGFETELKKRLMSSDLHILITPQADAPGFDQGFVSTRAFESTGVDQALKEDPRVESAWPLVATEVILKSGRKVTGVVLKGATADRLERLKKQVSEMAEPKMLVKKEKGETVRLPGVFVGQELAFEMGLIPGDLITVISPTETEGPFSTVPRLRRFVVEGIYRSGMPEQELHTVFATDQSVRGFLRRADVVSQWEVTLKDFDDAVPVADSIRPRLAGFRVQDWVQMNAHLFSALKLERVAMFVILAFIVVVASFNIITTLTLMVLEKKKEIAVLRTMGAESNQVGAIFLAEGLLIGGIGVLGGLGLGFLLCIALQRWEFIQLPDVYIDRTLPVNMRPDYYAVIAVAALAIVIGACLYPSKRASKLTPLDGIRYG
jgi:lipoprotein-releasing system permease protein